jgi:aerobic carbon-monoxide dehydrogenase large subunit
VFARRAVSPITIGAAAAVPPAAVPSVGISGRGLSRSAVSANMRPTDAFPGIRKMAQHKDGADERRVEDLVLLRGAGRFVADLKPEGAAILAFVRSPHAAARLRGIDVAAARKASGVLAVLTAADIAKAGIGSVARHPPMTGRGGTPFINPHRPALAGERVVHVGQAVAAVIAETAAAAQDAAELVAVDYEPTDAVADLAKAMQPAAPLVHPEVAGNLAFDWPGMVADDGTNAREIDAIIKNAATVARLKLVNQRIMVATMEPRGASAVYDRARDHYTLSVCSQAAGVMREQMAAVMNLPKEKIRVITGDVGGAFGSKTGSYPEYAVVMLAAKLAGRPVHWMSTRAEAMLSDNQARDAITEGELALDANGRFLALRVRHAVAMGAFLTNASGNLSTSNFARCFPAMYDIKRIDAAVHCVFTHALPTGAYRGAGRPEANYLLERLVEEAARLTGIDRIELRRRNLIPAKAIPYKTAVATTYDSGEFEAVFDKALALADVKGFAARRTASAARGRLRGLGVSCFLEHAGAQPTEGASIVFAGGEQILLGLGVQSTGQGHATVFPRLAAERLGIPADKIRHRHGDTDLAITGFPSVASRSTITAGSAIVNTADIVLKKGKAVAARLFEAAESDIAYRGGRFEVAGTDRSLSLFEVAAKAAELARAGAIPESLDTNATRDTPQTFPNGCHVAEVEIDPETGVVQVVSYAAVDDCGNILNHTIVEGQIHGSVAQGLGQVLLEAAVYDDAGQLVTGSFTDYAMPRADDMPKIVAGDHTVPARTNPIGVKGVGEAGTTASLAALTLAIGDAIPGGVAAHIDMPATREKVWRLCRQAAAAGHRMPGGA